jgi:cytochrome c553
MKKSLALMFFLLSFSMVASAVLPPGSGGSETKGKYYFKKTCKSCHRKDGEGKEVTPLSKTTAQWKAYFEAGSHQAGKERLTKIMDEEKLLDVKTYLQAHASDSPQPETCGE